MRNLRKPLVGVVLWGVLAVAARAGAAEPNVIKAIDVAQKGGAVEVAIQGTRAPSYTVFKLQDPPRLVVDLAGADVSQVASPVEVGKAGVVAVSTAQYKDERSAVGRVILALEGPRKYEVTPRGDAVVVTVHREQATASATPTSTSTSTATPAATPTATSTATSTATRAPARPAAVALHALASRTAVAVVDAPSGGDLEAGILGELRAALRGCTAAALVDALGEPAGRVEAALAALAAGGTITQRGARWFMS